MRHVEAEKRRPFLNSEIVTLTLVCVVGFVFFRIIGISEFLGESPTISAAIAALAVAAFVLTALVLRKDRLREERTRTEQDFREKQRIQEEEERFRKGQDEFRNRLLADVSHEIRTPLTGILGFASVLEEEVPPSHAEMVRLIRHNGDRLLDTVNSILEIARLDSSEQAVHVEEIDVLSELKGTAMLFEPHIEAQGLAFQLNAPRDKLLRARLDRKLFHRVLSNLLSNALKFTSEGGISVGVDQEGSELRLWVRDTGIGISEDFIPRLFQPYTQESEELPAGRPGSGLGLAITRRLVEMMNGRLEVRSIKDEGSTFVAIFPQAVVPLDEQAAGPVIFEAGHTFNVDL